jgi:hypothetical protein
MVRGRKVVQRSCDRMCSAMSFRLECVQMSRHYIGSQAKDRKAIVKADMHLVLFCSAPDFPSLNLA